MTGETQVLVVEDEPLIAMDLEDLLIGKGYKVVGPYSTADAALDSLSQAQPQAALLDIYLFSGTSFDIARELKRRGIRFAFMTGLVAPDLLPPDLADAPIILKPYKERELLTFIAV